jgi:FkbM family methyltransferase
MAFDRLARFLPKFLGWYLSPRRNGLRDARPLVRAALGDQRFIAVDVGAANGILPHWQNLDGIAVIYQIDPRHPACLELEAANRGGNFPDLYCVIEAAVAGSEGPRTLYVSNAPTGTSLFSPDFSAAPDAGAYVSMEYFLPMTQQVIETRTLKSLLVAKQEDRSDLIKLDIQGAELEALQGLGAKRLEGLLAAEIEVGLSNIYPEAAGFADIQLFMKDHDFELFDVRVARSYLPYQGKYGHFQKEIFGTFENSPTISARVSEFDAVYFKKRSLLLADRDAQKIRRMVVCYLTYNFFSEAYSLVDSAEQQGIFSSEDGSRLKELIVKIHSVREFRPWLANTPFWNGVRRLAIRVAPRSSRRWCQYVYQDYPSG